MRSTGKGVLSRCFIIDVHTIVHKMFIRYVIYIDGLAVVNKYLFCSQVAKVMVQARVYIGTLNNFYVTYICSFQGLIRNIGTTTVYPSVENKGRDLSGSWPSSQGDGFGFQLLQLFQIISYSAPWKRISQLERIGRELV